MKDVELLEIIENLPARQPGEGAEQRAERKALQALLNKQMKAIARLSKSTFPKGLDSTLARPQKHTLWTPAGIQRFSLLIFELANKAGLTQKDLATLSGVSASAVALWKQNWFAVRYGTVVRDISPSALLSAAASVGENPWYLLFVAAGFLDGRDIDQLEEAIAQIKSAQIKAEQIKAEQDLPKRSPARRPKTIA